MKRMDALIDDVSGHMQRHLTPFVSGKRMHEYRSALLLGVASGFSDKVAPIAAYPVARSVYGSQLGSTQPRPGGTDPAASAPASMEFDEIVLPLAVQIFKRRRDMTPGEPYCAAFFAVNIGLTFGLPEDLKRMRPGARGSMDEVVERQWAVRFAEQIVRSAAALGLPDEWVQFAADSIRTDVGPGPEEKKRFATEMEDAYAGEEGQAVSEALGQCERALRDMVSQPNSDALDALREAYIAGLRAIRRRVATAVAVRKAANYAEAHPAAPPTREPIDRDVLYRRLVEKPVPFANLDSAARYRGYAEAVCRANADHVVRAGLIAEGTVRIEYLDQSGQSDHVVGVRHVLPDGTVTLPGSTEAIEMHPALAAVAAELGAPHAGLWVAGVIASASRLEGVQHLPGHARFEGATDFKGWGESWTHPGSPMKPPKERHPRHGAACPECEAGMLREVQTSKRLLLTCSTYPTCRYSEWAEPERIDHPCPRCGVNALLFIPPQAGQPQRIYCECGYEGGPYGPLVVAGITCPSCGLGDVAMKWWRRRRKYWGCTRHPECEWSTWDQPVPTPCPVCGADFRVQKAGDEGHLTCLTCDADTGRF
jgi:ssDNA-binding Zn-finger/Zn-ribbon topoisomerase 1